MSNTKVEKQSIKDFTELRVWQLAMDLSVDIYRATERFPRSEQFGLTSQLRRASVSVPSNIAEGHTRNQTGEYVRFLAMARASLAEIKTQLLLGQRLGFLNETESTPLIGKSTDLIRQITSLRSAIVQHNVNKEPVPSS